MTAPVSAPILTIAADPLAVRASGVWLRELLAGLGSPEAEQLMGRLELALHEICMNIVDHAGLAPGAHLTLRGSADDHRVLIEVFDQGRPFDQSQVTQPIPRVPQIRGYGLMIVKQLVDDLGYVRTGDTNSWSLIVRRHVAAVTGGGSEAVPTTGNRTAMTEQPGSAPTQRETLGTGPGRS